MAGSTSTRMPPSSTAWRCSTPVPTSSTWAANPRAPVYPGQPRRGGAPRAARGARAGQEGAIVSIDTRHVAVAKAAVRCGASIVNDVTGFTDPKMVEFVATSTCGVIVMHAGEIAAPPARMRRCSSIPRQRRLLPRRRAKRLPRPRARPRSLPAVVVASCWASPRRRPSCRGRGAALAAVWRSGTRARAHGRAEAGGIGRRAGRPCRPRPPRPLSPRRSPMTTWPP